MIIKVDNVKCTCVIGGTDNLLSINILSELRNYLAVRPDRYGMTKAYQEGRWDGWQRFITPKGQFATGFLPMVCRFLEDLGVTVRIEDNRSRLPFINDVIDPYIGNIDGEEWTGRDYQVAAVEKLKNYVKIGDQDNMYFPRGILDVATNGGKTSIIAILIKNIPTTSKILYVVSDVGIYKQAVEFYTQVLGYPVGEIKSGKTPRFENFTVAMVQTLYNRASESMNIKAILNNIELLVVDESDEAGAKRYSSLLSIVGAGMRVFVSGTPLDANKVSNMIAIGLSGIILYTITNKYLIERGFSQNPKIHILWNNCKNDVLMSYRSEVEANIHVNVNRCGLIEDIINRHLGSSILISFITKEHGIFMYNYLKSRIDTPIAIAHGTTKTKDRIAIIEGYKSGEVKVLLASMIIKKGLNIPITQVGIMAQGGKSVITIKQVSGRHIRTDGENDSVFIYDFYDNGKRLSKHSRMRMAIYKKEGYEITKHYKAVRNKPTLIINKF